MILEIRQTASSGTNQFEITSGGRLLYRADASWMPLGVNATNKLHLLDGAGNPCFETRYSLLENLQESWLPYKYLFTGSQKFSRYEVLDANGGYAGCFFREATDLAARNICLEYGGKVLVGYKQNRGTREYVCFYDGETQVGQLTKSGSTVNNLDVYMLHFVEGYDAWMPMLAFFVIYYDFLYHNNSGEVFRGKKVSYTVTFHKNSNKFDKNFILRHFGEAECARMDAVFKAGSSGGMNMKLFWLIFGLGWGAALLITGLILLLIYVILPAMG